MAWATIITGGWHDQARTLGSETDLEAIDRVRDAHVAALNTGDAEAWVAQFIDDGVQMSPNAPANFGRTMIGSWSRTFLDQFRLQFALVVDEVRVLGEWAFERGGYTISLNPKAGSPPMQDIGKYITGYQRKPGDTWRMARDIWNAAIHLRACRGAGYPIEMPQRASNKGSGDALQPTLIPRCGFRVRLKPGVTRVIELISPSNQSCALSNGCVIPLKANHTKLSRFISNQ